MASIASLLAVEQLEGRLHIAPRIVCTNAELRTEEMTANIRAAWGVEPVNVYGATEGFYAGDCEHHQGMHVFEDLGLMEVVDERGEPVPDGVVGAKLLVSSFIKRTQPLIRYEVSDMAALTTEPCPCGRPLARMVSLPTNTPAAVAERLGATGHDTTRGFGSKDSRCRVRGTRSLSERRSELQSGRHPRDSCQAAVIVPRTANPVTTAQNTVLGQEGRPTKEEPRLLQPVCSEGARRD
jgi:hypothetical protein